MAEQPDWLKELMQYAKDNPPPPFKPNFWYNRAGDQIEVTWKQENYCARWLNHQVTLEIGKNDDEVIGVTLTGLKLQLAKQGLQIVKLAAEAGKEGTE